MQAKPAPHEACASPSASPGATPVGCSWPSWPGRTLVPEPTPRPDCLKRKRPERMRASLLEARPELGRGEPPVPSWSLTETWKVPHWRKLRESVRGWGCECHVCGTHTHTPITLLGPRVPPPGIQAIVHLGSVEGKTVVKYTFLIVDSLNNTASWLWCIAFTSRQVL